MLNSCGVVAPDATCNIGVSFLTAAAAGAKNATVTIASDAINGDAVVTLTGTLVANTAPTGAADVSDVTPTEGQLLTGTQGTGPGAIADVDGITTSVFSFQWQQSALGGGVAFANIAGATSPTFTPAAAQVNRQLRVVASFVDDRGTAQTVNSAATAVVGDLFVGGAAVDTFNGNAGSDDANGGGANDNLNGNGGNDIFRFTGTTNGFDAVNGGNGADQILPTVNGTIIGLRSIASIEAINATGFTGVTIRGTTGSDNLNFGGTTLTNIVEIFGGGGADSIAGSPGNDAIRGEAAADTLNGNAGNDTITGGAANDNITPGADSDVIVYAAGAGIDTVTGFDPTPGNGGGAGNDLIDIRALAGITAANFNAQVTRLQVGTATWVITSGIVIILQATTAGNVTAADFIID